MGEKETNAETLREIQNHVWRRLGVRKYLIGRERMNDLVEITVANWDHDAMAAAETAEAQDVVAAGMVLGVKRTYQMLSDKDLPEYGFLWAIILQALVSVIVQIIIKWWLSSARNRVMLWALKKELVG